MKSANTIEIERLQNELRKKRNGLDFALEMGDTNAVSYYIKAHEALTNAITELQK